MKKTATATDPATAIEEAIGHQVSCCGCLWQGSLRIRIKNYSSFLLLCEKVAAV